MIEYENMDDVMVRYIEEQKRMRLIQEEKAKAKAEPIDINKGYAYINDEKIVFSHFQLPGTSLVVMIPDMFVKGQATVVADSMAMLSNYNGSISLCFEMFDQSETPQTIGHTESWEDATDESGDGYFRLDFTVPFQQEEKSGYIKGTFLCVEYRIEDWKEILFQIMYSIN